MTRALSAEWAKVRTVGGTGWLLLAAVAVTVAVSAAASGALSCTSSAACHPDITQLSLTGADVGQAVVAVIAVLAVTGEYATGMIRTTFSAMPARQIVLGAKAATVAAFVFPIATAGRYRRV